MIFPYVLDSEVIHNQREGYRTYLVGPIPGDVLALRVPYVWKVQNSAFYLPGYHSLTIYQWIAMMKTIIIDAQCLS